MLSHRAVASSSSSAWDRDMATALGVARTTERVDLRPHRQDKRTKLSQQARRQYSVEVALGTRNVGKRHHTVQDTTGVDVAPILRGVAS